MGGGQGQVVRGMYRGTESIPARLHTHHGHDVRVVTGVKHDNTSLAKFCTNDHEMCSSREWNGMEWNGMEQDRTGHATCYE